MATDNPALLHYFLQDDLYLLSEDKSLYNGTSAQQADVEPQSAVLSHPPLAEQAAPVLKAAEQPKAATPAIPVIPQIVETPRPQFNCLGANKARFLILVNYAADEHMAAVHLKALESTLNRKALAIDDVAIVNTAKYKNNNHQDFITFYRPQKLLILGTASIPAGLGTLRLNAIEQVENLQRLYTHSFDEMLADREKAKAFWEQMKNL